MAKTATTPATKTAPRSVKATTAKALPLAAQLGTRVITAAQFGGQRPPVTTATRYNPAVVQAILAYAKTHTNEATKAQYGCSAHYVGKLRKAHGVPLYVPAKAAAPAPAAPAKPAKAPKGKTAKTTKTVSIL